MSRNFGKKGCITFPAQSYPLIGDRRCAMKSYRAGMVLSGGITRQRTNTAISPGNTGKANGTPNLSVSRLLLSISALALLALFGIDY